MVMTTQLASEPYKVFFYAPDRSTHHFFEQDYATVIRECSNNFTTWVVGTYARLQKTQINCEVVSVMPKQGIVIADRDSLANHYPYLGKVLLICAKGDREFHPSAQLHVVQNPTDAQDHRNTLWKPYYLPIWLQPGLMPRLPARCSLVENVAFIGTRSNLDKAFYTEQWTRSLSALDCQWLPIFNPESWSDYRHIDLIVAVRSFDQQPYPHKPASKLINCWRARVPAILAPESAFRAIQKSDLDFVTINSIEEAIDAVRTLKNNPDLYRAMVENGLVRAQEVTDENITQRWITFFQDCVFPEYDQWISASDVYRRLSFGRRYLQLKANRAIRKIDSLAKPYQAVLGALKAGSDRNRT